MNQNPTTTPSPDDSWQTKEVVDQAKQDFQSHVADVKAAAKQTVHEVQAAAATTATAAREGYQALLQDAHTHSADYVQELENQIRQQPLKSVGLAALGGLVVGLLVSKSSAF